MSRTLVAVTSDLLWLGKIRNVADKLGWRVEVPRRNLDVTEMLLHEETKLVLLDLHHPGIPFVDTIRLVRGTRWDTRLVCFGHHTDTERIQKAKEAGAPEVWPNSELDRRLPELLA